MDHKEQTQGIESQKKEYVPPQLVTELELEARAGSSLGLPDVLQDNGE
ncbi:MAG: hypothetical protein ACOY16_11865 [Chloroflexota bacterium]